MEEGIHFSQFSLPALWWLLALVALLFISALISGSETAFFSISPRGMAKLEEENSTSTSAILKLLHSSEKLLSTILITNNLVNIAAVLVASALIDTLINFNGNHLTEYVVKTVALTFFLLLFGEVMPKILATHKPVSFARIMAKPLEILNRVLAPFSYLLIKIGGSITAKIPQHSVSIDQIQDAIEITKTESAEDKRMLSGIARFSSTEAIEISIPRVDVVTLDSGTPYSEVIKIIANSGFSRIPVYKDDLDHVIGVLYIKDLLPHLSEADDFRWQKLLRKPYFVPEHKKIDDLLTEFQTRKNHMAIVVDEYGGTLGVVTMEDILEEIVGEITDESDTEKDFYHKISATEYIFEGKTHIGDLLKILNLPQSHFDAQKGDADTLAGLMLEIKGDFLKLKESLTVQQIKLTAVEIEGLRITKIKVDTSELVATHKHNS